MMNSMSNVEVWEGPEAEIEYPEDFHADYAEHRAAEEPYEPTPLDEACSLATTEALRLVNKIIRDEEHDGQRTDLASFAARIDHTFERLRERFPEAFMGLTYHEEDRMEAVYLATFWDAASKFICGEKASA
jgi:hypothetical protein